MLTTAFVSLISILNTYKVNAAEENATGEESLTAAMTVFCAETGLQSQELGGTSSFLALDCLSSRKLPIKMELMNRFKLSFQTSIKEASEITNRAEQAKKYESIIRACDVDYMFPEEATFYDIMPFLFSQTVSHASALLALSNPNAYTEAGEAYSKKAADLIEKHRQFYVRCSAAGLLKMHNLSIQGAKDAACLHLLGLDANSGLASLYLIGGKEEREIYNVLLKSISHGENFIRYSHSLIELAQKTEDEEQAASIKHQVQQCQLRLMHNYFDVCQYGQRNQPSLCSPYSEKMRSIHKVLKNDPSVCDESQSWMDAVAVLLEPKRKVGGRRKLAKYARMTIAKQNQEVQGIITSINERKEIAEEVFMSLCGIGLTPSPLGEHFSILF